MFTQACVSHSVHGGGPTEQRPPLYSEEWAVRILLDCILVVLCLSTRNRANLQFAKNSHVVEW